MTKKRLPLIIGITAAVLAIATIAFFVIRPITQTPLGPGNTPTAKANIELDQIFDPSKVSQTFIDLPKESITALNGANNDQYVAAKFRMIYNGTETKAVNIGIKIKGTTTRSHLNNTWYRPSFKLKFDWAKGYETQTLFGKRSLTLNAFVQDNSRLHETYAYATYRAMGVPAPRTGFTTITFEGKDLPNQPERGLYLVLESEDEEFFADHFTDVTQHVYENNHDVTDFDVEKIGDDVETSTYFKVKQGWKATPNRNDLRAFTGAINTEGETFWNNLGIYADRDRLIMQWAVDNFTGNWDTYSGPMRNNFTFRSDLKGKFTFIPWGTDQSFGENLFNDPGARERFPGFKLPTKVHDDFFITVDKPYTAYPGSYIFAYSAGLRDMAVMENYQITRGKMFVKCLAYAPCATQYFQNLQMVNDWSIQNSLGQQMTATANLLANYSSAYQKEEQKRTINWVTQQQEIVTAAIKAHCKLDAHQQVVSCK